MTDYERKKDKKDFQKNLLFSPKTLQGKMLTGRNEPQQITKPTSTGNGVAKSMAHCWQ